MQNNHPAWRFNIANTIVCPWSQFLLCFINILFLWPICQMFILMLSFHLVVLPNEDFPRVYGLEFCMHTSSHTYPPRLYNPNNIVWPVWITNHFFCGIINCLLYVSSIQILFWTLTFQTVILCVVFWNI